MGWCSDLTIEYLVNKCEAIVSKPTHTHLLMNRTINRVALIVMMCLSAGFNHSLLLYSVCVCAFCRQETVAVSSPASAALQALQAVCCSTRPCLLRPSPLPLCRDVSN